MHAISAKGRPVAITDVWSAVNPPPDKRIMAIIPNMRAQTILENNAGASSLESS